MLSSSSLSHQSAGVLWSSDRMNWGSSNMLHKSSPLSKVVHFCSMAPVASHWLQGTYINKIADFLLYLFQDKKLQPSTIDGYRTATANKVGNSSIAMIRTLLSCWKVFTRIGPNVIGPVEPLRKASLKHLTFKTVFVLSLVSGKHRSDIHAWMNRYICNQEDWSQVSHHPLPSFLSDNQLAQEGPDSLAPVVIPALALILDKSLKEDRSLCPVRTLCYYLDRSQDLRDNK